MKKMDVLETMALDRHTLPKEGEKKTGEVQEANSKGATVKLAISQTIMASKPKLEVLQAEVDGHALRFFRLLVDGRSTRYVTVEYGIYSVEDICFGPSGVPPTRSSHWGVERGTRGPG